MWNSNWFSHSLLCHHITVMWY